MARDAFALLSGLVLEDGRSWGEAAAPFQVQDARAIVRRDERRLHFLTRPRGASKTTDLAGIALAVLLQQAPAGSRSYALAADRDQARLLLDSVEGFVQRTEGLGGAVEVERWKVSARAGGASLEVLASDAASSWGLRPFFTVVDEIAQWPSTAEPRRLWESVVSAQPKVVGSRLVVLTTAGDPAHWSRKVLELAQGSSAWRAREVAGPCPWVDRAELKEQRRLLSASQYARLHLNEWTAPEDRLSSLEDVRACVGHGPQVLDPVEGERYVVALDLGVKSDRSVMAVAHAVPGVGAVEVVLDRMEVWVPVKGRPVELAVVESAVEAAASEYGGAECVFDPWQAMGMAQRLRGRGVRVSEFTFSQASVGRLAATLHRLLRDRLLDLPDDDDLVDELAHVQLRETAPGIVRMDHASGRHDDRAVALGLAALHLLEGRDSGRGGLRFGGSAPPSRASRAVDRFLAGG